MKIVFVGPLASRFVRNDLEILSRAHHVVPVDAIVGRGLVAIKNLVTLQVRIVTHLLTADALFFWFADYYALIPTLVARLLGKKVFVVAGGFDVWYLPELGIGAKTRPARWFLVRNTFRFAHHIFPVSAYADHLLRTNVPVHGPSTVIYNTVDSDYFAWDGVGKKAIALTVTQVDTVPELQRKGIDVFIRVAKLVPEMQFLIVGIRSDAEREASIQAADVPNVTIIPAPVESEALRAFYREAAVYLQLSIDETFGVAVLEGMSCGCVPIVSTAPALKEVVGPLGSVLATTDIAAIALATRAAQHASSEERAASVARARTFNFDARAKQLLALLDDTV